MKLNNDDNMKLDTASEIFNYISIFTKDSGADDKRSLSEYVSDYTIVTGISKKIRQMFDDIQKGKPIRLESKRKTMDGDNVNDERKTYYFASFRSTNNMTGVEIVKGSSKSDDTTVLRMDGDFSAPKKKTDQGKDKVRKLFQ